MRLTVFTDCTLRVLMYLALYDSPDEHTLADLTRRPRELTHALIRS